MLYAAGRRASAAMEQLAGTTMATDTALFTVGRYRLLRNALIALFAAALLAGVVAIETRSFDPGTTDHRFSNVRLVTDGSAVSGATSMIERTNEGIDIEMSTSGLPRGHIVVLRAIVFNHPENCRHGTGELRCGSEDVADPAVEGSVIFVAANQTRNTGSVKFSNQLRTADKTRVDSGSGLTNPHQADVHLIVMDHGPAIANLFSDQMTTLGGGCQDS
ncbi:MAG: hypothetical protein EPO22_01070, partial [Dehalococcoidia bacterium]